MCNIYIYRYIIYTYVQKQSQTCANLWGGRFAAAPATRVECRLMCCNFCTSCKAWISPATSVPLRSKCCRFFMDAMIFNLPWDGGDLGTGYYQNIPELGHLRYLRRHTNSYDSGWLKCNWLMNCDGRNDTALGTSSPEMNHGKTKNPLSQRIK